MSEQIKILKLGRKQQPSKYKPGDTYAITTIMDEKNRKLSAMGKWSENWKVGDTIEAIVEEKKWVDRDGFEQTNLALKNPVQSSFKAGGGYAKNTLVDAYLIAAELASVVYSNKKRIVMKDIDELAVYIKEKIEQNNSQSSSVTSTEDVPTVDISKSEKTDSSEDNDIVIEDADDDKPF